MDPGRQSLASALFWAQIYTLLASTAPRALRKGPGRPASQSFRLSTAGLPVPATCPLLVEMLVNLPDYLISQSPLSNCPSIKGCGFWTNCLHILSHLGCPTERWPMTLLL